MLSLNVRTPVHENNHSSHRVWPNYGLSGGQMELGARARGKAAMVLVLLAKDVVSLQKNTEIGKS